MSLSREERHGEYVTIGKDHFLNLLRAAALSLENPVTGLPNAKGLESFWRENQALLKREHKDPNNLPMSIIFGDLSKFKPINEVFGYEIGDKVLLQVGTNISSLLRPGEIVSNPHGDEFIIVIFGDNGGAEKVKDRVRKKIKKIKITELNKLGTHSKIILDIKLKHVTTTAGASLDKILEMIDQEFYDDPRGNE